MTNLNKLFMYKQNVGPDFLKRFRFLNNIRSKYLTVLLLICSSLFVLYDFFIVQKDSNTEVFLLHFKADIIFLVLSMTFTLFIYFNQVKTHHNLQNYHKYIHGIISLSILIWSVFKSILFIKYSNGSYNLAFISIFLTSLIYLFPTSIYFAQLLFVSLFAIIISLAFNITINKLIYDFTILMIFIFLSIFVSRYIFYLQYKVLLKEKEIVKYKKRVISSIK